MITEVGVRLGSAESQLERVLLYTTREFPAPSYVIRPIIHLTAWRIAGCGHHYLIIVEQRSYIRVGVVPYGPAKAE